MATGSGVRSGSVKNSRPGRGLARPARRLKHCAVRTNVQKPMEMADIPALEDVLARIDRAAQAAGRDPSSVQLVAVSKTQAWDDVEPVLLAGQRVFGENRVQEAMTRWADHRAEIELHLIGPLQTNKVREAVAFFDVIETLDREKLARSLAEEIVRSGKTPRLYVQVNTGEEPQKAGVLPGEADAFIALCRGELKLKIEGLMAIPPADQPAGPHFALLRKIAARNGLALIAGAM